MPKIAVVCRNRRHFLDWCREERRNPHDRDLCCVLKTDDVRGRWFDEVIYVSGDYRLTVDANNTRLRKDSSA